MKGISVWMFSKIVMLVFLVITFSTVLGFMRLTNERVMADSAEALAMQIKDAMQTALYTHTVSSQAIVPIPKTLPELGDAVPDKSKTKPYTVFIKKITATEGDVIYVAIGWGSNPTSFVAASSFLTKDTGICADADISAYPEMRFPSDRKYLIVKKDTDSGISVLKLYACNLPEISPDCVGCPT